MSDTVERDDLDVDALMRLHQFECQALLIKHPELHEQGVWRSHPEYWKLDVLHKADHELRKSRRKAIEVAVEKQNAPKREIKSIVPVRAQKAKAADVSTEKRKPGRPMGSTKPKPTQVSSNLCRKCNKDIIPTGRKGRPAAFHLECRPEK